MKQLSFLFLLLSFVAISSVQAQEKLDKGYIKFEVTDVVSDDPAMAAQLSMMKGTTNELHFTKEKSLSQMNMMGGMMKVTVLSDLDANSATMLFDAMGQKFKIPMTADDRDAMKEQSAEAMGNLEFEYDKSDTKVIAGYKCHKVTIKGETEGFELSAYVTEEIESSAEVMQGVESKQLKGFPLEYIINNGMFSMVFSALEVKNDFDVNVFNLDTKGFKEMTMEEFQSAMGGMGGLGF